VTLDTARTDASRLNIYIDGVLATNLTQNSLIGNAQAFLNEVLYNYLGGPRGERNEVSRSSQRVQHPDNLQQPDSHIDRHRPGL